MSRKEKIAFSSDRHFEDIWFDDQPFFALDSKASAVPIEFPDREILSDYFYQIGQSDSREAALSKVTTFCLPTIRDVVMNFRNLGVSDENLVREGLLTAREQIIAQAREKENISMNELLLDIEEANDRNLSGLVTSEFGLDDSDIDIIQGYFAACTLYKKNYGVEPSLSSINELIDIAKVQKNNGSGDQIEDSIVPPSNHNLFTHIHNKYHGSSDVTDGVDTMPSAEEHHEFREKEKVVKRAVYGLDPLLANVVDRIFYVGESVEDIATNAGITHKIVRELNERGLYEVMTELKESKLFEEHFVEEEKKTQKRKKRKPQKKTKGRKVEKPKQILKVEVRDPEMWSSREVNRYFSMVAKEEIKPLSRKQYPQKMVFDREWVEYFSDENRSRGHDDAPLSLKISGERVDVISRHFTNRQSLLSELLEGFTDNQQPAFSISALYKLLSRKNQIMSFNHQGSSKLLVFKTDITPKGLSTFSSEHDFHQQVNRELGYLPLGVISNMFGVERYAPEPTPGRTGMNSSQNIINWHLAKDHDLVFYQNDEKERVFKKLKIDINV